MRYARAEMWRVWRFEDDSIKYNHVGKSDILI